MSDLGPTGELHLVAAALRSDTADIASYTRVLTTTLGDALPPGMVTVERKRSFADRMAGREGEPIAVIVRTPDEELELRRHGPNHVSAEIRQVVRGVVIKRRPADVDTWLVALARVLTELAQRSAAARAALEQLLAG
jgi:hypothetical protein